MHIRCVLQNDKEVSWIDICSFCLETKRTKSSSPKKEIATHRSLGLRYFQHFGTRNYTCILEHRAGCRSTISGFWTGFTVSSMIHVYRFVWGTWFWVCAILDVSSILFTTSFKFVVSY